MESINKSKKKGMQTHSQIYYHPNPNRELGERHRNNRVKELDPTVPPKLGPDQVTGAALPNDSSRRKSEARISFPQTSSWLQASRSHKASRSAHHFCVRRILAPDPAHNQYP